MLPPLPVIVNIVILPHIIIIIIIYFEFLFNLLLLGDKFTHIDPTKFLKWADKELQTDFSV